MGNRLTPGSCFDDLVALVGTLRGERGCPWDRAQTPETIRIYLIEEAYEVLDAIDRSEPHEVCGELGDLLFHIVFLARLFEEAGGFDMADVIDGITAKMTRRHPHVFGDADVTDVQGVKDQWKRIKAKENGGKAPGKKSVLDMVPGDLPTLLRAYRIKERALPSGDAGHGKAIHALLSEVEAGRECLEKALQHDDREAFEKAYGDMLLTLVDLGRAKKVHPDTALSRAIGRFAEGLDADDCLQRIVSTTTPTD